MFSTSLVSVFKTLAPTASVFFNFLVDLGVVFALSKGGGELCSLLLVGLIRAVVQSPTNHGLNFSLVGESEAFRHE